VSSTSAPWARRIVACATALAVLAVTPLLAPTPADAFKVHDKDKAALRKGSLKFFKGQLAHVYKKCASEQRHQWAPFVLLWANVGKKRFGKKLKVDEFKIARCATYEMDFESEILHQGHLGNPGQAYSEGKERTQVYGEVQLRYNRRQNRFVVTLGELNVVKWEASGLVDLAGGNVVFTPEGNYVDPNSQGGACSYRSTRAEGDVFKAIDGRLNLNHKSANFGELEFLTIDPGTPREFEDGGCSGGEERQWEPPDGHWRKWWVHGHQKELDTKAQDQRWRLKTWKGARGNFLASRNDPAHVTDYGAGDGYSSGTSESLIISIIRRQPGT
jgi:hypothetical protein